MNQVVDDVLTRETGGPPGGALKLGVAADLHRDVDGPGQRRIGRNLGRDTDALQDRLGQGAYAHPFPAAYVVHLTGEAELEQRQIRFHHVGHVQEVADRVAIADREAPARWW